MSFSSQTASVFLMDVQWTDPDQLSSTSSSACHPEKRGSHSGRPAQGGGAEREYNIRERGCFRSILPSTSNMFTAPHTHAPCTRRTPHLGLGRLWRLLPWGSVSVRGCPELFESRFCHAADPVSPGFTASEYLDDKTRTFYFSFPHVMRRLSTQLRCSWPCSQEDQSETEMTPGNHPEVGSDATCAERAAKTDFKVVALSPWLSLTPKGKVCKGASRWSVSTPHFLQHWSVGQMVAVCERLACPKSLRWADTGQVSVW